MDMEFLYILPGWEGSTADSRVFENAWNSDFIIPVGRYYLADAGYANSDSLLVPYHGVWYHIKEWASVLRFAKRGPTWTRIMWMQPLVTQLWSSDTR
jgi:hypothetical protein